MVWNSTIPLFGILWAHGLGPEQPRLGRAPLQKAILRVPEVRAAFYIVLSNGVWEMSKYWNIKIATHCLVMLLVSSILLTGCSDITGLLVSTTPTSTHQPINQPINADLIKPTYTLDAQLSATVQAYKDSPPLRTWCGGELKGGISVCAGNIHYLNKLGNIEVPSNTRFVVVMITFINATNEDIDVKPNEITLVMEDGGTYKYTPEKYKYWGEEIEEITLGSGGKTGGGQVFLVPNTLGLRELIYRGGLYDSKIIVNFDRPPDISE